MNEQTRINMIEQQIRPWEVLDEIVLALYRTILREEFVAEPSMRDLAYADIALPIGFGQTMLEPKLEARMLQALALQPHETVLHIGGGSGFFAALLSHMAAKVLSVEIVPELANHAAKRLASRRNVQVQNADGARGLPGKTFDVIVLTGGTPKIAPEFWDMLNIGGRLLAVDGYPPAMTLSRTHKRAEDIYIRTDILETQLPFLQNAPGITEFKF